jgi:hypothetical protein
MRHTLAGQGAEAGADLDLELVQQPLADQSLVHARRAR